MCLVSLQLYAAWKSLVSLAQTPDMLWLWQQVKKQCCVAYPAMKLSSTRRGDVTQLSSQGSTRVDCLGPLQEEAKQGKEGKGSVVYTAHQLRRHWDLMALNYKQVHVTNIMGGCLGLIFNQLGSQRAAALWDIRNSFPLKRQAVEKLTAASH